MSNKQIDMGKPLERSFTLTERAVNEEARTVEIAFSSEEPYERYFGMEVLSHEPQSMRLGRLNGGAAVLVNHDTDDQIGVVESARIDGDKKGRAVIRFSKSARGQEIMQDVNDGIRTLVSVGYRIHKYTVEEREGKADLVTATDWEPYELSIVSIPADTTVGVGRSVDPETEAKPAVKIEIKPEEKTMDTIDEVKPVAFDHEAERAKVRTEEAKRRSTIDALADKYEVPELAKEAITEGWDVPTFNAKALEKLGERNNAARAKSKHDGNVDLSPKDTKRFSMLRLMDAIAHPNDRASQQRAGFELEVSAEAVRAFGSDYKVRGQFVPENLLGGRRDLSAGTATDGAELVAANLLPGSYIEVLRNTMVTAKAGITMLSGLVGNVDIPRQTTGAASTWVSAEDGDATEGEAQFDQVSLTPKDLACYTEVTRRLLMQSTPSIEGIVMRDLAIAQALGIDLAVLYGSAASGQPRGIKNQTGVNTKDLTAAAPTYAEIIEIVKKVLEDNALVGSCSWIISPAGWEDLSTTPKQGSGVEGNFILGDSGLIAGYNWQVSNQVTAEEYFFGDFSQVLLGEWGGLEINVDPYTQSLKGRIRYITFKTVDVAVRQPTAFCYSHDGI